VNDPTPHTSLPLATLLNHTADAVQAVRAGQSLNAALARCPGPARPGTQALSFHALRWLGSAQALRTLLAPKAPAPAVDALLLTALALLWPQSDPPYNEHTLVDQAVAAANQRARHSAGFVNAVLRRFLRERDALVAAALRDAQARFNHPAWWVERLQRDWPADWQAILDADNQHPPMTLRVNARRTDAAAYVARLAEHGLAASVTGPQAVTLARPCPVTQLPGFADGDVSVQDAAAQLAAPLLIGSGLPGPRVLDACAAPGGKTAHLLELADLDVLALDSDPARLTRVDDTLTRLRLSAQTRAGDAGNPAAWWDGQPFDAILLDAPCSAAGIVRRHPDVRWLRRSTDIAALAALQARLLDALWPLLKPGGRLLYCTCSVFKAEGQDQIDAFLQRQPEASPAASPPSPGHLLPLPDNALKPPAHGFSAVADGFFYALIAKT
jgi:16S rRNA (cytosine967-C5)-methyltransferase